MEIPVLKQKFVELAGKHGLVLGVLFGSQATGKTHAKSDIDVGFIADRQLSLWQIAELQEELMVATGQGNIKLIDLNYIAPATPETAAMYLDSVLLYEKEQNNFAEFQLYAQKLYMECHERLKLILSA